MDNLELTTTQASHFARLALAGITREYPNAPGVMMNGPEDALTPRALHPAFYGCFDWHSSVHGHWLLVLLVRTFPDASFAPTARDALKKILTAENLKEEANYLRGKGRASFERPYGLSWLLQLCAELREWDDPQAREMSANLRPLAPCSFINSRRSSYGSVNQLASTLRRLLIG